MLGCSRSLGSRHMQVALENAKQRIARCYFAAFQKVEDCGKRLCFCLRIDSILAGPLSEMFGWAGSLDARPNDARAFYATIAVATLLGAALSLVGLDPVRALYRRHTKSLRYAFSKQPE